MKPIVFAGLFIGCLFFGMLALLEIGRRFGLQHLARDKEGARAGVGIVESAIFGLMGLIIAFTFASAAARFDTRRQLIVEEANSIGTAWLRIDLVPAAAQPRIRELFRQYLDTRLTIYRKLPDIAAAKLEFAQSTRLGKEIWLQTVAAFHDSDPQSAPRMMLVLPSVNQMLEMGLTRTMATQIHPPVIIFIMLMVLALLSAALAGYNMAGAKRRSWPHVIAFTAAIAITIAVILEIEYPRRGVIHIGTMDKVLAELRQSMN